MCGMRQGNHLLIASVPGFRDGQRTLPAKKLPITYQSKVQASHRLVSLHTDSDRSRRNSV
jgi:hypothetical protein